MRASSRNGRAGGPRRTKTTAGINCRHEPHDRMHARRVAWRCRLIAIAMFALSGVTAVVNQVVASPWLIAIAMLELIAAVIFERQSTRMSWWANGYTRAEATYAPALDDALSAVRQLHWERDR